MKRGSNTIRRQYGYASTIFGNFITIQLDNDVGNILEYDETIFVLVLAELSPGVRNTLKRQKHKITDGYEYICT